MGKRTRAAAMAWITILASVWLASAQAQWSGEVTPYVWAAGIEGEANIGGNDVDWAVRVGYRRLHYDIEGDAGNEFDAGFHGFIVGFGGMF